MTLSLLGWLAILLPPLLCGFGLLRRFGPPMDPLARIGWSWLLGSLVLGVLLFAWLWTGVDPRWGPAGLLLAVGGWGLARPRDGGASRPRSASVPRAERIAAGIGLAALLAFVAAQVGQAWLSPIVTNDEANIWALKSKVLFASDGFGRAFRDHAEDPTFLLYHKDYPLLNPLLQLWVFEHAGRITHVANRVPIQLFYVSLVLIAWSALRARMRPAAAVLMLAILVAPIGEWSRQADGEALIAAGAFAALDAWLRWRTEREPRWFALAAVALSVMLLAKNEGLLYLLAIGIGVAAILVGRVPRFKLARVHLWALLPLAAVAGTWLFNVAHGFESAYSRHEEGTLLQLFFVQFGEHAPRVLEWFGRDVCFATEPLNLLLPCFAALVLLSPVRTWRSDLRLPVVAITISYAGLLAVFIGTPAGLDWHLHTAGVRVCQQLYPCVLLVTAAGLASLAPWLHPAPMRAIAA